MISSETIKAFKLAGVKMRAEAHEEIERQIGLMRGNDASDLEIKTYLIRLITTYRSTWSGGPYQISNTEEAIVRDAAIEYADMRSYNHIRKLTP